LEVIVLDYHNGTLQRRNECPEVAHQDLRRNIVRSGGERSMNSTEMALSDEQPSRDLECFVRVNEHNFHHLRSRGYFIREITNIRDPFSGQFTSLPSQMPQL
jgi:hypothetical protein